MAGGPPALPPEITNLSFFFSDFKNSDEAAEYVVQHDQGPGTFILRPSTRNPCTLTLTISIENNHARHVNVQRQCDSHSVTGFSFFIIPERLFPSFHDLYAYYTRNAICNLEQVNNVKLLSPLSRTHSRSSRSASLSSQVLPGEIPPLPTRQISNSSFGVVTPATTERRPGRNSLDSVGSETPRTSGSSNGSSTGRDGAEGGADYFAPGSPGEKVFISRPDETSRAVLLQSGHITPPPLPTPLSEKDLKKLNKQEEKKKKEREKREKKVRKHDKKSKDKNGENKPEMDNMVQLGWCRPPMPTPTQDDEPVGDDEPPYYSSPRPYKNHLEELKKMLRESEICDCGLKMIDAELVDGWTVHRSRESATYKRVFYQHENGNTTWNFPTDIEDLLSVQQVQFIVDLCTVANQPLPAPVLRRHQAIRHAMEARSTDMSARSRSSSSSSDAQRSSLLLNRGGATMDQQPSMSGPGAQPR